MIFDACELFAGIKDSIEDIAFEQSAVKVGLLVDTDSKNVVAVVQWQYDCNPDVNEHRVIMPFCEIETIKMSLYNYALVYGRKIGHIINDNKKSPA